MIRYKNLNLAKKRNKWVYAKIRDDFSKRSAKESSPAWNEWDGVKFYLKNWKLQTAICTPKTNVITDGFNENSILGNNIIVICEHCDKEDCLSLGK